MNTTEPSTVTPSATALTSLIKHAELYAREALTHQLSPQYIFHNLQHTVEVVAMAQEMGLHLGLTAEQMDVITIAAWFHDIGYTQTYVGHEEAGAAIARKFLEEHDCPQAIIEAVVGCILATKMPQTPKNLLEQILCDADVANLGMEDFLDKTERLREELEAMLDMHFTDEEWYVSSLNFCKNHQFHTQYAQEHFAAQQASNAGWGELFSQYKEHAELLKSATPLDRLI